MVSDASPLVSLAAVGQLELLRSLYGNVIVPEAVFQEVVAAGAGRPGSVEVGSLDWIESRAVSDRTAVTELSLQLDQGEAEAIVLATELKADFLLVDERRARTIAIRRGLRVIGALGVLVSAKTQGILPAVRPVLDQLVSEAGVWLAGDLYRRVLEAVGEDPKTT